MSNLVIHGGNINKIRMKHYNNETNTNVFHRTRWTILFELVHFFLGGSLSQQKLCCLVLLKLLPKFLFPVYCLGAFLCLCEQFYNLEIVFDNYIWYMYGIDTFFNNNNKLYNKLYNKCKYLVKNQLFNKSTIFK